MCRHDSSRTAATKPKHHKQRMLIGWLGFAAFILFSVVIVYKGVA